MRRPAPQDPVALGMTAYVRGRFALGVFGREHLRIGPGQILAPSRRSDNDVPALITVLGADWPASSRARAGASRGSGPRH